MRPPTHPLKLQLVVPCCPCFSCPLLTLFTCFDIHNLLCNSRQAADPTSCARAQERERRAVCWGAESVQLRVVGRQAASQLRFGLRSDALDLHSAPLAHLVQHWCIGGWRSTPRHIQRLGQRQDVHVCKGAACRWWQSGPHKSVEGPLQQTVGGPTIKFAARAALRSHLMRPW